MINGTADLLEETLLMESFINKNGTVNDMFYNKTKLILSLKEGTFDENNAYGLAYSTLRMGMIIGDLAVIDLENRLLNCSTLSFKLFLPSASKDLVQALQNYICTSPDQAYLFVENIQNNTNFNFIFEHLQSNSLNSSSKIAESVQHSLSFVSGIANLISSNITSISRRKRNTEAEELIPGIGAVLANIEESIAIIQNNVGEDNIMCLLEPETKGNMIDQMKACNLSSLIDPLTSLITDQIPIWKPITSLVRSNTPETDYESHCKVNVNRFYFLTTQASERNILFTEIPNTFDISSVFNCTKIKKRQTEMSSYSSMFSAIDLDKVLKDISKWRDEEFISMNWTTEAGTRMTRIMDHMTEIAALAEILPEVMQNSSQILENPTLLDSVMVNYAAVAVDKLSLIMEDAGYFMKNTDMWENYTQVYNTIGIYLIF